MWPNLSDPNRRDGDFNPDRQRRKGNLFLIIVVIIFSLTSLARQDIHLTPPPAEGLLPVEVERAVDADTLIIHWEGRRERLRLIGIDAPESVAPQEERNSASGELASAFTKRLVENFEGQYYLELDEEERDQYGRLLGYLWMDDVMLNEKLCVEGFARAGYYPPNLHYNTELYKAEAYAMEHHKGLWGEESLIQEVGKSLTSD